MAAGGHFGCLKFTFVCISGHFRSKCNFHFFSQNGRRRPFWMSEIHFRLHFSSIQMKTQLSFFFTKWPPAAILDVQNSFSFAFLVISDENATFIFFLKMAAGGHFGSPKLIFFCISRLFSPFSFAFHYLRCMMNLPMRNGEHKVVPVKPNKC